MGVDALVVGQDLATVASGLFNGGYFADYGRQSDDLRGRRIGAMAMVLVSAAAVVEALFSQSLFWLQRDAGAVPAMSSGVWALLRLPLLLATFAITAIIVRRMVG